MRCSNTFMISLVLPSTTAAHYLFGRLIFDNKWTETWEYVRQISGSEKLTSVAALVTPNTDPTSTDIVCGRNATRAWNRPKTARIHAGATVGFAAGEPAVLLSDDDYPSIFHAGIASAWLSKSPVDDLNEYQGDGEWFKIMSVLKPTEQSIDWTLPEKQTWNNPFYTKWGTYKAGSWNFTIPDTTPPGKYLLRFEHIYPNKAEKNHGTQYYPNCAHVEIVNDSPTVGQPGPLVKIPGVYVWAQPDIYYNIYASDFNFSNVREPAPVVWEG